MGTRDKQGEFLGYKVEKVGDKANGPGYLLHGPRATYTLMRCADKPNMMYALNSNYNVCAVKGNYHFNDASGELKCVY